MAQDAQIKLVLDTKEFLQEAKSVAPKLEAALKMDDFGNDFLKNAKANLEAFIRDEKVLGEVTKGKLSSYEKEIDGVVKKAEEITTINERIKALPLEIAKATKAAKKEGADAETIARPDKLRAELNSQKAQRDKLTNELSAELEKIPGRLDHIKAKAEAVNGVYRDAKQDIQRMYDTASMYTEKEKESADAANQSKDATAEQADTSEQAKQSAEDIANATRQTAENEQQAANAAGEYTQAKVKQETGATPTDTSTKKVKEETSEAKGEIAQLVSAISSSKNALDQLKASGEGAAIMEKNLAKDTAQLNQLLSFDTSKANFAELVRYMGDLAEALKLIKTLGMPTNLDNEFNKIAEVLQQAKRSAREYQQATKEVKKSNDDTTKAVSKFGSTAQTSNRKAHKSVSGLSSAIKSVKDGFKNLTSSTRTLSRLTDKVKSSFNGMAHSMRGNFKHLITSITKYVLGFRSLFFLVRRLRKYIGEGIQNMAQFNDGNNHVNESITRLLSSLLYLKNAWATAFSPILQFVTPWLEHLIDSVARAGNAVSRFIGSLLGQENVFQAVKVDAADYAKSLDNAAGSAGSAADKTKKLTDRLAAFDDLNVLGVDNDPDGTGSGGGGGGADAYMPDPNEMFEIVSVGREVLDKLKEMWNMADFTELGTTLRNKLLNALTEVSNNLDAFRDTAYNIGKSIITFFNGVFGDTSLWYSAGSTLGKAVNVVSEFVRGMLENNQVDWGGGLASLVNGFFASTDWEMIRDNISNFVIEVKNNVISFLKTLNWTGDEGIFEAFKELGTAIGIAISETIGDAEFMGSLGDALGKLITAILITWKAILDQNDGDEIGDALYEFFASLIDAINWDTLAENLSGSLVLLLNAISKFSENLSEDDTFQQALSDFVENLDLDTIFAALGRNISSSTIAATSIADAIVTTLNNQEFVNKLIKGVGDFLANLDVSGLTDSLTTFTGHLIALLVTILADPTFPFKLLWAIIDGLSTALANSMEETAKSVEGEDTVRWFEEPGWMLVEGLVKGIGDAIEQFFSAVASPFIAIEDGFKELFGIHSPSTVFEGYGENIIEGLKQGIENLIDTVMEPFTKLSTDLEAKWTEIKDKATEKWTEIKNKVTDKATEIKDSAEEKFDTLKTNLTNKWQEIKGAIYEKLVGIKLNMKEVFEQMGETIKAPINTIIDIIEGMVNKCIDGINSLTSGLGTITDLGSEIANKIGMPSIPHIGQLSHITIPHLAQGAVIPPNKEFMAVLGDQSNGTNIEAPLDTIKQAVAEVLANNGNAEMIQLLQQLITVVENKNLVIGDKDIGKANARYVKQQNIVRGSTF